MNALTERQLARHAFRMGLFQRRGLVEPEAERLADRLLERDADLDSRRVCLECEHLQPKANRDGTDGCFMAEQRRLPGVFGWSFSPLRDVLQRCPSFSFQRP